MSKKNSLENKRARRATGFIPHTYPDFYKMVTTQGKFQTYTKLIYVNKKKAENSFSMNTMYLGAVLSRLGITL
ncbi:MAG: hypothetical protein JHC33_13770 [Ignisphaera sp.]|jgi:hypothetical protein|nr:hypothetical protein [Ignisphaera sp.]